MMLYLIVYLVIFFKHHIVPDAPNVTVIPIYSSNNRSVVRLSIIISQPVSCNCIASISVIVMFTFPSDICGIGAVYYCQ